MMSPFALKTVWAPLVVAVLVAILALLPQTNAVDASSVVSIEPAEPLLDVPFLASPSVAVDKTLYISKTSTCNSSTSLSPICVMGGSVASVNYNTSTCIFNVTSISLDINLVSTPSETTLYWCSSATGSTAFGEFKVSRFVPSPGFVFYDTENNAFTLNTAVPVGSQVGVYSNYNCGALIPGSNVVTLEEDREVHFSFTSRSAGYICASVPSVLGGMTSLAIRAVILATERYEISTTEGVYGRNVSIDTGILSSRASFSTDPNCLTLAQPAVSPTSGTLFNIPIQVLRGSYYFCLATSSTLVDSLVVYIPASNMFNVLQYDIFPRHLYAGKTTAASFAMDAVKSGVVFEAALFGTLDCQSSKPLIAWSRSLQWTVNATGTYYSCVREAGNPSGTVAPATTITVTSSPSVALSRVPAVWNLTETATVYRNGNSNVVLSVGLSSNANCESVLASGVTTSTGTKTTFVVPTNSTSPAYYCISTPGSTSDATDAFYYYPLGELQLRAYELGYPPLRINTDITIELDTSVSFANGATMKLVPTANNGNCDSSLASGNNNYFRLSSITASITPVRFTSAGEWLLCIMEPGVMDDTYVPLRTLTAYGNASLSPSAIITGLPTTLIVRDIPGASPVYLTDSTTCGDSADRLASATASVGGLATLVVQSPRDGTLTLCVGYQGDSSTVPLSWEVYAAGTVVSASPVVYPSAVVADYSARLTFLVPDALLLVGSTAYLVGGTTACTANMPTSSVQLPISAGSTADAMPYTLYSPSASAAGTTYNVCVGTTGAFVSAGTVYVAAPLTVTTSVSHATEGLPLTITFSGTSLSAMGPEAYVVISADVECSADLTDVTMYAAGVVDSLTGVASSFTCPVFGATTTVRVCVGKASTTRSATVGYTHGGDIPIYPLTALSKYAQHGTANMLSYWPARSGVTLFLTPCTGTGCVATTTAAAATCASSSSAKYYTSSTVALEAPIGYYILCQSAGSDGAVTGSNTTIQVVEPWSATASPAAAEWKQYQSIDITLRGGTTSNTSARYTLRMLPKNVSCNSTDTSSGETFTDVSATDTITVQAMSPVQSVHLCLVLSAYDTYDLLAGTLSYYMSPFAVIADEATTITSAGPSGSLVMLSSTSSCESAVSGGSARQLSSAQTVSFTITECGLNAQVSALYYCESVGGSQYTVRGMMGLLRRHNCTDGLPASIVSVDAAPAQPFDSYGIDTVYMSDPTLSTSSDCSTSLPSSVNTVGYTPAVDDRAYFYVCVTVAGIASRFTTSAPTLHVKNWVAEPTTVLSRYNVTMGASTSTSVRLNYRTPSSNTFFSSSTSCSSSYGSAEGLSTLAIVSTYTTTGVNGFVYVCTVSTTTDAITAVAKFLSVTPPTVVEVDPAVVRGHPFRVRLVVQSFNGASPLYSMVSGADSNYDYASYYTSSNRAVYLSTDSCASVLSSTSQTTVSSDGSVSFPNTSFSSEITSVAVCAGTAAGVALVINVDVAVDKVYPVVFVTGTSSPIYAPLSASTTLRLSASNNNCDTMADLAPFSTNSNGYAVMELVLQTTKVPAPSGLYTVCYMDASSTYVAVSTIELVDPVYYDIRGEAYVVGVPSVAELLEDLTADVLLEGFSTSTECASVSTSYGSWSKVSTTSIMVAATRSFTSGLYLCATNSVNKTITALPTRPRSIQFVTSALMSPSSGWDVCTSYDISQCYYPGTSTASQTNTLAVAYGNCCSETSRANVVGSSSMGSGDGICQITLDGDKVSRYPAGTNFSLCIWDTANSGVCATVDTFTVKTDCTPKVVTRNSGSLSTGVLVGIIVPSVIVGLLLLALILWLLWSCYCRPRLLKEATERHIASEMDGYSGSVAQLASGIHPLLYYPATISGHGVNASVCSMAASTNGCMLLDQIEDDERDQVALQEARARYNLRLMFIEGLDRICSDEKNESVEVGYEAFDVTSMYPQGVAQPEIRRVESLDLTDVAVVSGDAGEVAVPMNEDELPAFSADAPHGAGLPLSQATFGRKSADTNDLAAQRVASRSIESSRAGTPTPHQSFITNDDFEEQEEVNESQGGDHVFAETGEEPLSRRLIVRRISDPMSVKLRGGAGQRAPNIGAVASDDDSAVLQRSPIASDGARDISEGIIPVGLFAPSEGLTAGYAEADGDVDLMSFTTTQRFHDDKRFLLEQEEGRRQRLLNWEEESRFQLVQHELEAYMGISRSSAAKGSTEVPLDTEDSDAGNDMVLSSGAEGNGASEAAYKAPRKPARLPPLPPAPRPQALQNAALEVVSGSAEPTPSSRRRGTARSRGETQ